MGKSTINGPCASIFNSYDSLQLSLPHCYGFTRLTFTLPRRHVVKERHREDTRRKRGRLLLRSSQLDNPPEKSLASPKKKYKKKTDVFAVKILMGHFTGSKERFQLTHRKPSEKTSPVRPCPDFHRTRSPAEKRWSSMRRIRETWESLVSNRTSPDFISARSGFYFPYVSDGRRWFSVGHNFAQ